MHESYTDLFAARSSERKLAWPSVLISQNGGQDVINHAVLRAKNSISQMLSPRKITPHRSMHNSTF
jgi:hypothetical protein